MFANWVEIKTGDYTSTAYYTDDGVVRWKSNNRCVPEEYLKGFEPMMVKATRLAREIELEEFLAEYRAAYRGPSDEEKAEARAAMGAGVKMVNVITGDEWTT